MKELSICSKLLKEIFEIQKRWSFEADFCSFVAEMDNGSIPSSTVAEDSKLLDKAYEIFREYENKDVSYKATMMATISEIESLIAVGEIKPVKPDEVLVDIIVEDGEVVGAYSTNPDVRACITDLSSAFLSEKGKAGFWKQFDKPTKHTIPFSMNQPSDKE